ncbi:MAG: universal stress protein [Microthrixaceae bacterium]
MTIVLAALDSTAVARPVLETALGIGRLMGASVEAVHVHEGAPGTSGELAERSAIPIRMLDGPVVQALLDAVAQPDVIAAVLGSRSMPGDRRPAGHTALEVLRAASKPIVVVPPEALGGLAPSFHRLLVPLEGSAASSRPVVETLLPLIAEDVDLLVLHVLTGGTTPRFLDRPARDLELLSDEFLCRHCPTAARIEVRTGRVGRRVEEVCREEQADLIVLSWSQTMTGGHAAVVREVLLRAEVPVLLLPTASGPHEATWPAVSEGTR